MRVRAGWLGFNGGWAWDFRLCGSWPGFSRGAARWAASRREVFLALGWWYVRLVWGRELVVEGPENTDWLRSRSGGRHEAQ